VPRFLELLCPKVCVSSLAEVDLDALIDQGIKAILLDLDNTILPWKDREAPSESIKWINDAKTRGLKLCIASNTHNPKRLRYVAERLGIPCMHNIAKPSRRGLRRAMVEMGETESTTAMIGDQIFTDILGGNRLSLHTILVEPMHRREFIGTKISRLLEIPVKFWLVRKGILKK
jgi:HAD superfamily phosphatase (TIGR01668 family)